jgi:hypothetical protein
LRKESSVLGPARSIRSVRSLIRCLLMVLPTHASCRPCCWSSCTPAPRPPPGLCRAAAAWPRRGLCSCRPWGRARAGPTLLQLPLLACVMLMLPAAPLSPTPRPLLLPPMGLSPCGIRVSTAPPPHVRGNVRLYFGRASTIGRAASRPAGSMPARAAKRGEGRGGTPPGRRCRERESRRRRQGTQREEVAGLARGVRVRDCGRR